MEKVVEERGSVEFIAPVPKSKRKDNKTQADVVFDAAYGLSYCSQRCGRGDMMGQVGYLLHHLREQVSMPVARRHTGGL